MLQAIKPTSDSLLETYTARAFPTNYLLWFREFDMIACLKYSPIFLKPLILGCISYVLLTIAIYPSPEVHGVILKALCTTLSKSPSKSCTLLIWGMVACRWRVGYWQPGSSWIGVAQVAVC